MFDSHRLFMQRITSHIKELSRYLRYIFNGHIAIAMLFLISALAVFYQQWLAQLPEDFPAAIIIGILFGLVVSYSPVRTLLKEPDLVFLIVAEHKMNAYFRNTIAYSYLSQLYVVLLIGAALGPLYFNTYPDRSGRVYLLTLVIILIFKGWNLITNWWMLKVRDITIRRIDQITRLLLNIAIFYFAIEGNLLWTGISTIIFIFLFLYDFTLSRKQAGLAWDLLVEKDQSSMRTFYRIANMFTDVPHLKNPIKKRRLLVDFFSKRVSFKQKYTFDYLYRITFIRSGDYLGMYLRLLVLGSLFIYFVPNEWMKLLFVLLFLYMSIFQMMTLYNHHRTVMWLNLYPVNHTERQRALIKWLLQLGITKAVVYAMIFLMFQDYGGFVVALVGGIIFNLLFIYGYVKQKLV